MVQQKRSGKVGAARAVLLGLLLIAVIARALVPTGYMVARSSSDSQAPMLIICTSHGSQQIAAPDGSDPDQKAPSVALEPCAFAQALALGGPPADAVLSNQPAYPHPKLERAVDDLVGQKVAISAPLGSRAPPRSS